MIEGMPLELLPLCTATVGLAPPIFIPNTPVGTRVIGEVTSVTVEGERIEAHQRGAAAADWLTMAPDGTLGSVDVRVTWETDDGAVILVQYRGRFDTAQSPAVAYVSPLFETGDERYAWLNRIQAVGRGTFSADMSELVYEMYEVR